jgi:peptidoglycan hydrolase-like protein with peptidoglycan-binding domain
MGTRRRRRCAAAVLASGLALALAAAAAPAGAHGAAAAGSGSAAAATSAELTSSSTAAARHAPLLRQGMRGAAVREWQQQLNVWLRATGGRPLVVDGVFGPRTHAATVALQRAARIAVDGIVGPQTRAALARLGTGPSAPFAGTIGISQAPPVGHPVAVTNVRTGYHAGFDRLVFDLYGSGGHAGWRVLYIDSPVRRQGSGDVVPLAGDAQLHVVLTGIAMPDDADGRYYAGPQRPSLGRTGNIADLFVSNLYEGNFETFVGARSPEQFRVFRLENPKRIVVDIAHTR